MLHFRYDSATDELISDEIRVAFPIQNGIPNLIPHDGRLLKKDNTTSGGAESNKDEWDLCGTLHWLEFITIYGFSDIKVTGYLGIVNSLKVPEFQLFYRCASDIFTIFLGN